MENAVNRPRKLPIIENGVQLLSRRWLGKKHDIGCVGLTELLNGGFRQGELTEIAGRCAVGKTQLCLTFLATVIYDNHHDRALYIDTTGSFDPYRISEIVLLRHQDFTEPVFEAFMSRILVVRVFSRQELFSVLDALEENVDNIRDGLVAVIVDHINAILNPDVATEIVAGYHRMVDAGRRLKSLAMQHNLVVIVTNSATELASDTGANQGDVMRAALGNWWSTMANTRILLSTSNKADKTTVVKLEKCATQPIGGSTEIEITSDGVNTPVVVAPRPDLWRGIDNRPASPVYRLSPMCRQLLMKYRRAK